MITKELYCRYLNILHEELVPAMGCTEPIAIAYAAAKAKEILGCMPARAEVGVSGNIVKNAKSVVVPHTGGLRGMVGRGRRKQAVAGYFGHICGAI